MIAAEGILTARGGVSSHAALVARQMGKVCVCGASALQIDYESKTLTVGGQTFNEGDFLSIDGTLGDGLRRRGQDGPVRDHPGPRPRRNAEAKESRTFQNFTQLMKWCAQGHHACRSAPMPTLRSRPRNAVAFGAAGIGLTRTEHMFFEGDRIDAMREMILADNTGGPQGRPGQAPPLSAGGLPRDLQGAQGLPGHHPLPRSAAARIPARTKRAAGRPRAEAGHPGREDRRTACTSCTSSTRCSGFRGCRLGIKYPEITRHAGPRRLRGGRRGPEAEASRSSRRS